ncbi:MAG: chromosomal replication initiator protein DnaA [Oscillospiraceae bacterium]|jgi:chromosomal replication initiator protein|nr:chromosomal replication initiator protein DnaA [Oscillospiraceae bacterium]
MEDFRDLFALVKEELSNLVSATIFNLWIDIIEPVSFDGTTAVLAATSYRRPIIEKKYSTVIHEAFEKALGFDAEILFVDKENEPTAPAIADARGEHLRHAAETGRGGLHTTLTLPVLPHENTFETFIIGNSNKFACAAAQAVAANPGLRYNPLFIHSNPGLGKTHLLSAIQHEVERLFPDLLIVSTTGEKFTNEMVATIQHKTTAEFRQKYRSADVLLVDDVQFIAGREATQEEFFHTFNSLADYGKQIVLCSDRPPKEMDLLEDRLKSRFEKGLIADIQAPELETRMAIIKRKAAASHFDIPDDIVEYIAQQLKQNIRQLEGAVNLLEAFIKLKGMHLNMLTAQNAIADIMSEERPLPVTIDRIIEECARSWSLTPADVRSKRRTAEISKARQTAMYIIGQVTHIATTAIGKEFGRDHSTVVYAHEQIRNEMERDPGFKKRVNDITKAATT